MPCPMPMAGRVVVPATVIRVVDRPLNTVTVPPIRAPTSARVSAPSTICPGPVSWCPASTGGLSFVLVSPMPGTLCPLTSTESK